MLMWPSILAYYLGTVYLGLRHTLLGSGPVWLLSVLWPGEMNRVLQMMKLMKQFIVYFGDIEERIESPTALRGSG